MEWPVPGPGHGTCSRAVTLSLSFRVDLLACQCHYNRKKERETKNETIILRTQSYELISLTTDWYSSMATFRRIRCTRKIHLHLNDSEGGKNPCRHHLYLAKIQRSEEEKRETRKHRKVIPSSISSLPNLYSSDHPYL
jgi:hypothetical protein